MNRDRDHKVTGADDWSDLSSRMKWLWLASFVLAMLFGIALGLFLTFA